MKMESNIRSLTKAVTWYILGIVLLLTVSSRFINVWSGVVMFTIIYSFVRIILYYIHERVWQRIKWQR